MPADPVERYATRVVDGKRIAGQLEILACRRHLDDLERGHRRGLYWDADAARDFINFCPSVLSITEGAKEGEAFKLLPWHQFVAGSMFGWKRDDGVRRFRFVFMETGKGQAKSPLMGAVGIYLMAFTERRRNECYAIAEGGDQAEVLFRDAVAMCRAQIPDMAPETLESRGTVIVRGIGENAHTIEHPASSSFFKPYANVSNISGPKPIGIFADEIHEMKTNRQLEIWRKAIVKVAGSPLFMMGTNCASIDQVTGTEYAQYYERVLRGQITDDSALGFICRVDPDDDPMNDEKCWGKALPALGITYPVENIRAEVNTSRTMISTQLTTKRLYFGIPVGTAGFWIAEDAWESVQGEVNEDDQVGNPLHLSVDLSQKNDLTALSGAWEDGESIPVKTWYYTTRPGLAQRKAADMIPYDELEEKGLITVTDSAIIDYSYVAAQIMELCAKHDVQQLAVDSAHLQSLMRAFEEANFPVWIWEGPDEVPGSGLKLIRHPQGARVVFEDKMLCMPKSVQRLKDGILDASVIIDTSQLTTICASNAVLKADGFKNEYFDKNRSRGRIDGMVSIAMAVGSATSTGEKSGDLDEALAKPIGIF